MAADVWDGIDMPDTGKGAVAAPLRLTITNDAEQGNIIMPEYLYPGLIYSEGVTMIGGRMRAGKSTVTHCLAHALYHSHGLRTAWFRTAEDIGYKARNQALGRPPFVSIVGDLTDALAAIETHDDVRSCDVFVFDPIRATLDSTKDNNATTHVRAVAAKLFDLVPHKPIIAITHLRKGHRDDAPWIERFVGSSEWVNVASLVLGVYKDDTGATIIGQVESGNRLADDAGVWRCEPVMSTQRVYRRDNTPVDSEVRLVATPEHVFDGDLDEYQRQQRAESDAIGASADAARVVQVIRESGGFVGADDLKAMLYGALGRTRYYEAIRALVGDLKLRKVRDMKTKRWAYELHV